MKKNLTQLINKKHKYSEKILAHLSKPKKGMNSKEYEIETKRLEERYHHFDDLIKIKLKEIKK